MMINIENIIHYHYHVANNHKQVACAVYNANGWHPDLVGSVREDGSIYNANGWNPDFIGSINDKGEVYNANGWNPDFVGSLRDDGSVYNANGWNPDFVGSGDIKGCKGAAALLLLLSK